MLLNVFQNHMFAENRIHYATAKGYRSNCANEGFPGSNVDEKPNTMCHPVIIQPSLPTPPVIVIIHPLPLIHNPLLS